jgi:hypothetical protein
MSGRPAFVRQRDAKQVIMAAMKAGAFRVEIPMGKTSTIVHLRTPNDEPAAEPEDSNNSFDKIMKKPGAT